MTVAVLGLTASACSIEQSETVPEGQVVVVDGEHPSPTDELANRILKTSLATEAIAEGQDEPLVAAEMVGSRAVKTWSEGKRVAAKLPDLFKIELVTTGEIKDAQTAIKGVADPKTRKVISEEFSSSVIEHSLDGVRFDYIEPVRALKNIRIVNPKLSKTIRPVLEDLDAGGSVIDNYDFASGIERDVKDLNGEAKTLALQYARNIRDGVQYSEPGQKLYEELYARYRDAVKKVARYARRANDAYIKSKSLLTNRGGIDAAVRKAIVEHNGVKSEPIKEMLPKLSQPWAAIDLSNVVGNKSYREAYDQDVVWHQFGEIYAQDGSIQTEFYEDSNLSDEARAQLERLIDDVKPLLASAFAKGDLLSVRFTIGDDFEPYFDPTTHEIVMGLSRYDELSEDLFRTSLVHETVHSLSSTAFSQEVAVSREEASAVNRACNALSREAYNQFELEVKLMNGEELDSLVESSKGPIKKAFKYLKTQIESGKLSNLMAETVYKADFNSKDLNDTRCTDANFADMMYEVIGESSGYEQASEIYEEMQNIYDKDQSFNRLVNAWIGAIHKYSLFKQLNESSFVKTDYVWKDYLGHSRDNASEMIASVTDVSLSYPKEVRELIVGLNSSDRAAVESALDASYKILYNRHPNLKPYLKAHLSQLTR